MTCERVAVQASLCVLWEEGQVKEGESRLSHPYAESDLKMKNTGASKVSSPLYGERRAFEKLPWLSV